MTTDSPTDWRSVAPILESIANGLECGLLLIDEQERIVLVTEPMAAMLGSTVEALARMTPVEFMKYVAWLVDEPPPLLRGEKVVPDGAKVVCEEFELTGPCRSTIRWVARRLTAPWSGQVVVCSDITPEVNLAAAFERVTVTDGLTNLPNRRQVEQRVAHEAAVIRHRGDPLSFVLLGVDGLERINAAHGHGVGDQVLRKVARLLAESIGPGELAARWDGALFLLMLPQADLARGRARAERLRAAVEDLPIGPNMRATITAGVAQAAANETVEDTIRRVEQQLGAARAEGANRIR